MKSERPGGVLLNTAFRVIIPFTLIYGSYVLFHGEFGPGGAFQAGAVLAIGVLLSRLIEGEKACFNISGNTAFIIAGLGAFIYGGIGVTTVLMGGNFLEYEKLPLSLPAPELHSLGILSVEIGVTICVMCTIIAIFDALTRREGPL